MSDADVIQTDGLTRYFGCKCAVDSVSLAIPRGSVTALLGRNGSGKSTLIRMLLGLLEPTRGSARVLGHDARRMRPETRGRIGYIAEGHPLIDWMRVCDLRAFQKSFYPTSWNDTIFQRIVDHFRLSEKARAGKLSRGERAGLSLALALSPQPELLVMDDPALGLDPVARRTLLETMILITRDSGRTILFSSHLLADVERVADRIAILDRSVLRACSSIETFMSRVKCLVLRFVSAATMTLPQIPGLLQARRDENELRLTIANFSDAAQEMIQSLAALEVHEVPINLEDAMIGYLGDRGEMSSTLLEEIRVPA